MSTQLLSDEFPAVMI